MNAIYVTKLTKANEGYERGYRYHVLWTSPEGYAFYDLYKTLKDLNDYFEGWEGYEFYDTANFL